MFCEILLRVPLKIKTGLIKQEKLIINQLFKLKIMKNIPTATDILSFWFNDLKPEQHFKKDEKIDAIIIERFQPLYEKLCQNEDTFAFCHDLKGKQAAILVFDQFARNMFRGQAKAFEKDNQALKLAKSIISSGQDKALPDIEKSFVYMPFMHSENLEDQAEAVKLYATLKNKKNLQYANLHYDVIKQFGRFPHRNIALGRKSTTEEIIFIKTPGTAF